MRATYKIERAHLSRISRVGTLKVVRLAFPLLVAIAACSRTELPFGESGASGQGSGIDDAGTPSMRGRPRTRALTPFRWTRACFRNRHLFGGVDQSGCPADRPTCPDIVLGDTWVFRSGTWTEQNVKGPAPRMGAWMVSWRDGALLYGGGSPIPNHNGNRSATRGSGTAERGLRSRAVRRWESSAWRNLVGRSWRTARRGLRRRNMGVGRHLVDAARGRVSRHGQVRRAPYDITVAGLDDWSGRAARCGPSTAPRGRSSLLVQGTDRAERGDGRLPSTLRGLRWAVPVLSHRRRPQRHRPLEWYIVDAPLDGGSPRETLPSDGRDPLERHPLRWNRLVLVRVGSSGRPLDTWSWDGTVWTELPVPGPLHGLGGNGRLPGLRLPLIARPAPRRPRPPVGDPPVLGVRTESTFPGPPALKELANAARLRARRRSSSPSTP